MAKKGYDDLTDGAARLWSLIDARTSPGADTATIDRRIWDLFGERWAIVFTDLAGFSRRVAKFGIIHFLQTIHEQKKLLLPIVADHDGLLLGIEADSLLMIFRRPSSALRCAVDMQRACARASERRSVEEAILLCVGVGYGDVLRVGGHDVYGAEVNAASKLGEDSAKAGDILVTGAVRDACAGEAGYDAADFEELCLDVPGAERSYRLRYACRIG